jgi:hypothetical protein
MTKFRSFALVAALTLLAQAFAASRAGAQVLVYELEILKENGINYHPFEGGFFVAPLLGGTGTFLLTSTDGGRTFTESGNSGRLFTAVDGKEKKAVISATTGGTGTAQGALVAIGKIDHGLTVNSPTTSLNIRVAKSLTGTAVSADDESTASAPATDGSIGSAGVSQLKLVLDEPATKHANNHGLSLSQTVAELKLELQRRGYQPETTPTPTPATGTTTTGTTSGS